MPNLRLSVIEIRDRVGLRVHKVENADGRPATSHLNVVFEEEEATQEVCVAAANDAADRSALVRCCPASEKRRRSFFSRSQRSERIVRTQQRVIDSNCFSVAFQRC